MIKPKLKNQGQRGLVKTLSFFSYLFKPYKWQIIFLICLILINIGFSRSLPYIFGNAIDTYFEKQSKTQFWTFVFFALSVLSITISSLKTYLMPKVSYRITADLRLDLIKKLLYRTKLAFFQKNESGKIINRATEDVDNIGFLWQEGLITMAMSVIEITVLTGVLFYLSSTLTFLFLPVTILTVFPIVKLQKKLRKANQSDKGAKAALSSLTHSAVQGHSDIKTFQQKSIFSKDFQEANSRYLKAKYESVRTTGWIWSASEFFRSTPLIITFIALYFLKDEIGFSTGQSVAYLIYLRSLFDPVQNIITSYSRFQNSLSSADKVIDILKSDVREDFKEEKDRPAFQKLSGPICFKDVCFSYEKQNVLAINNVSFELPEKGLVSIVGRTGSGKSTLLKLITKLYKLKSGQITIGSKNIEDITSEELRQQIAVVEQHSHAFSGTLIENITSFKEESADKVRKFVENLGIGSFLDKHPLDKVILPGGKNLSFGEKQLLALIRALYKNPAYLLLDEATAFIDPETESFIQKALNHYSKNHLCIVVTHKLSTIGLCDHLLALKGGQVEVSAPWAEACQTTYVRKLLDSYELLNKGI